MLPTGGFAGLGEAFGGSVEYQQNWNPHFHGNVHLVSIYQHKTITEIAEMIESNLVNLEALAKWQCWTHREDHFNHDSHQANLEVLEAQWNNGNRDPVNDGLCQLLAFMQNDTSATMWSSDGPLLADATTEAALYKEKYFADAQYVMSRCHHHWHRKDPKSGERHPLRGCLAKGSKHDCKQKFPMTKRLNLIAKVVCPGNARKHGLRVSGRRNSLGMILGRRRCEYASATMTGFLSLFRHNTHTGPNYRVPLLESTHDPDCDADCLQKKSISTMIACAQRAMRNTTGYYSGYIAKRQPIGTFALKQAAINLRHLAEKISHKSNPQQFHHVANRMLGDLECRGRSSSPYDFII